MRQSERGFTLIETLVALVILTVVGAIFFQHFIAGTRALEIAGQHQSALRIARAQLTTLGYERPLVVGTDRGKSGDGMSWSMRVKPHQAVGSETQNTTAPNAFWVTVTVRWRDQLSGKKMSLHLTTLKLGGAS